MGGEEGRREQWEERQEGQANNHVPAINGEICSAKDELCAAPADKPKAHPCRALSDADMHVAAWVHPALPTPTAPSNGNTTTGQCFEQILYHSSRQPHSENRFQNNMLVPVSE